MAKTATRSVELEPIDRLEEKLKRLVEHGRADEGRAGARRGREPAARPRARRDARHGWRRATRSSTSCPSLKEERDVIRTRVGEMLEQLEALNLLMSDAGRVVPGRDSRTAVSDPEHARAGVRRRGWRPTSTRRCAPRPTRRRPATRCAWRSSPRSTSPTSSSAAATRRAEDGQLAERAGELERLLDRVLMA